MGGEQDNVIEPMEPWERGEARDIHNTLHLNAWEKGEMSAMHFEHCCKQSVGNNDVICIDFT